MLQNTLLLLYSKIEQNAIFEEHSEWGDMWSQLVSDEEVVPEDEESEAIQEYQDSLDYLGIKEDE